MLFTLVVCNDCSLSLSHNQDGILCLGVRFNLIDVIKKGNSYREEVKLSTTNASTKVEQTVSSIMGSRFLSGMTRISIDLTKALDAMEDSSPQQWKVEGLVSKAPSLTARDGSVARESQFFSINGRPVELPKVSRAIGDAWRAFEGTKKRPACVLCFTLPNNEYDVNLSPDKREVLLTNQDALCSLIHGEVTKLWSAQNDGNFAENAVQVAEERPRVNVQQPAAVAASTTASNTGEASEPEASPRRRFPPRNAFVHDPGMLLQQQDAQYARLQQQQPPPQNNLHSREELASKASPADQNVAALSGKSDKTAPQSQMQTDDAANVAQATPMTDEVAPTTATPATGPSPLPPGQRDRPSNEERGQWASVQSSFNRSSLYTQRDEIQALQQQQKRPAASSRSGEPITPEEFTPMQEDNVNQARSSENTAVSAASASSPVKRSRTFTLEDFAFRPANKMTKPSESTRDTQQSTSVASRSTTRKRTEKMAAQPHEDEIDSRKRYGVSLSQDQRLQEDRRKRQKASESIAIASRPSVRAQQEEQNSSSDGDAASQETSPSSVEPEETLVWNSFDGTDAVMKATKDARFSMRSFRKELRAISRAPHGAGENDAMVGGIEEDGTAAAAAGENASQVDDPNAANNNNVVSLSKEDFRHMKVIGQFNLGFILATCRNNHLWILDQHACDEKYNFERLCTTTVIHEQKLIAPMPLELSPTEESCILENMQVFEENGFRFAHNPDKPPRHQLSLTALPHSGAQDGRKAVQFGKEDVHALCAMLSSEEDYAPQEHGGTGADGSGMYGNNAVRRHAGVSQTQDTASKVIARLPKAIAMFANRACRGSVMIGTALSQKEMEGIVKRLADMENPWTCAHGRPTMKHVQDLLGTLKEDEQRATSLVAGPTMAVMTQMTQNEESLSQEQEQEKDES